MGDSMIINVDGWRLNQRMKAILLTSFSFWCHNKGDETSRYAMFRR